MIRIFYGENRQKANEEIKKHLGENYEIIDGIDLELNDLPNIFFGASLFGEQRKILIRDLSANKPVFEKLPEYLNSSHDIILFETKLDKRSVVYKDIKGKIEIKEFPAPKDPSLSLVFNIYDTAKTNGKKAIENLEKIKLNQDPIMFFGLMVSQALKDYQKNQGTKEKKALKELSKLDIELKSSKLSSWLLIESFLLQVSKF